MKKIRVRAPPPTNRAKRRNSRGHDLESLSPEERKKILLTAYQNLRLRIGGAILNANKGTQNTH